MKLLCIADVKMRNTDTISFKAGNEYEFNIHSDGSLSRYSTEHGYHSFSASSWGEWFKYQLELESVK